MKKRNFSDLENQYGSSFFIDPSLLSGFMRSKEDIYKYLSEMR